MQPPRGLFSLLRPVVGGFLALEQPQGSRPSIRLSGSFSGRYNIGSRSVPIALIARRKAAKASKRVRPMPRCIYMSILPTYELLGTTRAVTRDSPTGARTATFSACNRRPERAHTGLPDPTLAYLARPWTHHVTCKAARQLTAPRGVTGAVSATCLRGALTAAAAGLRTTMISSPVRQYAQRW